MARRMLLVPALAAAVLSPGPLLAQEAGRASIEALCQEYLQTPGRSLEAELRRGAILAELEGVELSEEEAATWRSTLLGAVAAGGPRLIRREGFAKLYGKDGAYGVAGETEEPTGILIRLHGSGPMEQSAGPNNTFTKAALERGWVVVHPARQGGESRWDGPQTEPFVVDVVEAALRTWDLDRDRVFLAGYSMGAIGTWQLGARHADLFAGLAPIAGGPLPPFEDERGDTLEDGLIPNLRNVAIAQFQSAADPRTPVFLTRDAKRKLEQARERWGGYAFDYTEVEDDQHAPPKAGATAVLRRVEDAVRPARPPRVVWQPTLRWKHQFYWLWWDDPVPGTVVVADLDPGANAVDVRGAGDLTGLEVLLDDRLLDLDREVVVRLNGVETYRGRPERELGVILRTAVRGDDGLTFEARVPVVAPGGSGPLSGDGPGGGPGDASNRTGRDG